MAEEIERIYTVPLRKAKRVPRTKRAPYAIRELKQFITKHMKPEDDNGKVIKDFRIASKKNILDQSEKKIFIDEEVNEHIWAKGRENPPSKIRVKVLKTDDGLVEVSLPDDSS